MYRYLLSLNVLYNLRPYTTTAYSCQANTSKYVLNDNDPCRQTELRVCLFARQFLPRDAMLAQYVLWPCVRLSVW